MTNENTVNTELSFEVVPARIAVQIGKRKRFFDDTPEGHEEARMALDRFQNGTRPANKGIQAARRAAKALKQARLDGLLTFTRKEGVTEKSAKQHANYLLELCEEKPEIYPILVGAAYPVPEEGDCKGAEEIVDPTASQEAIVEPDAVESEEETAATDPLADLLG